MQSHRFSSLALALIVGAAAAIHYSLHSLFGRAAVGPIEVAALSIYTFAFFTIVIYAALITWVRPALVELHWPFLTWLMASVAAGLVFAALLPPPSLESLPTFHRLEIVNTGTKNADAKGTEVWLITIPPGVVVDEGTGWELREGGYVSAGASPAVLNLSGWLSAEGNVTLRQHPWSGIAQYRWDGTRYQVVDLFSDVPGAYLIPEPEREWRIPAALSQFLWASYSLCLGVVAGSVAALAFQALRNRSSRPGF